MYILKRTLIASALVTSLVAVSSANQIWQVSGGATNMYFNPSNLEGVGMQVSGITGQIPWKEVMAEQVNFGVSPLSTLRFETDHGRFVRFIDGDIQTRGGFTLTKGKKEFNYNGFRTVANGETPESDMSLFPSGVKSFNDPMRLDIKVPLVNMDISTGKFNIAMMNWEVSSNFANNFLNSDAAGIPIGLINFDLQCRLVGGDPNEQAPNEEPNLRGTIDVGLSSLSGLTQVGHIGTYPNGTAGLAMSTTSCGMGTDHVPWFAAMDTRHPVIVQNLYRLFDGKIEHVGEAYLKHGWLSTNSQGCGSCPNPISGQWLGPACSDTYGSGNNSAARDLGPREEVNPFTGIWTCTGSMFSNYQNDCVDRRSTSTAGIGTVARRIEVLDSVLALGGEFVYEAYYITPNDINKYNQIGWRKSTATWSTANSRWNFATTTGLVNGPAIDSWTGSTKQFALPRTDGDIIVANKVTDAGGGRWFYDFAVYNHDMDRQIKSISFPIESGLTLSNVGFHDSDNNATNGWNWSYSRGKLTFSTTGNEIAYGSLYNFRFEANIAPVVATQSMTMLKPGSFDVLTSTLNGPTPPQPVTISGTLGLDGWIGGNVNMTVTLAPTNGDAPETYPVVVAGDGTYSFQTTLRGSQTMSIVGSHWLNRVRSTSLSVGATAMTGVDLSMVNGDVDMDNEVGPGDFSAVSTAFGSDPSAGNWNAMADLDGDEEVGPNDFAILSANFGQSGD